MAARDPGRPVQPHPEDPPELSTGSAPRRERLVGEFFRNAMALAMLKQVLVAGHVGVKLRDGESGGEPREAGAAIPGHLEG